MGLVYGQKVENLVLVEMVMYDECVYYVGDGDGGNGVQGVVVKDYFEGEQCFGDWGIEIC